MSKLDISVIIPVYNEEENVKPLYQDIVFLAALTLQLGIYFRNVHLIHKTGIKIEQHINDQ